MYVAVAVVGALMPLARPPVQPMRRLPSQSTIAMAVKLPKDIKGLVDSIRTTTQAALDARLSRVEVEVPLSMGLLEGKAGTVPEASRQLARIFCEMFSQLDATTVVAFPSEQQVSAARKAWRNDVKARLESLTSAAKPSASRKGFGSGKKARPAPAADSECDIVFVVGPLDADGLAAAEEISKSRGPGVLVALLNAHVDTAPFTSARQREYFENTFTRVLCFRPFTFEEEEFLLFRGFPHP